MIYHEKVIVEKNLFRGVKKLKHNANLDSHEKVTVKRISSVGLLVLVLAGVPSPAQGQGWYLGSELGAHVIPTLDITGLSNDRASVCDEFINPQYATVTQTAGYETYNCTGPDRSNNWVNQFAKATGLHTGWALGYRFGADASGSRWRHVRTEVEYFYRATAYDQTVAVPGLSAGSDSVTADKLNQELQTATDYLGRVTSHHPVREPVLGRSDPQSVHALCRCGGWERVDRDDLWQSVVEECQSYRDCHRRGAAQRGRDSPESRGHDKQFPGRRVRQAG